MKLPEKYVQEIKALLGEEYGEYEKCLEGRSACGLRVNNAKISTEEFLKLTPFSMSPVPWVENGFYYNEEDALTKHPHYHAGLYYIQEPSAMIPASRLPVEHGDKVLDLCAAPGGKATELAAKLGGTGLLVANDISNSRAKGLLKNLEMAGHRNILVTSEAPKQLLNYFPEYFDKILVDVPCSGEGMFRRDPSMIKSYEEKGPEIYAPLQQEILSAAIKMLKPGGMLLYSTCTFSTLENEKNIQKVLDDNPEMEIADIRKGDGFSDGMAEPGMDERLSRCLKIWPHRAGGEGHFAALLLKAGSAGTSKSSRSREGSSSQGKAEASFLAFAEDIPWLREHDGKIDVRDENLYLIPGPLCDISIRGLRFLRTGLLLGTQKKGRFEPSQALAMCLRQEEYPNCVSLAGDSIEARKYLKGETVQLPGMYSGWVLVCADGYPLGWAKGMQGALKNKYYPGWRMQ